MVGVVCTFIGGLSLLIGGIYFHLVWHDVVKTKLILGCGMGTNQGTNGLIQMKSSSPTSFQASPLQASSPTSFQASPLQKPLMIACLS